MAFDRSNFAPIGNTSRPVSGVASTSIKGAPSMWSYVTADTRATLNTAGYFDNGSTTNTGLRNILAVGDLIYALCGAGSGGTLDPAFFTVLSNSSGIVDVSDGTQITISDTD